MASEIDRREFSIQQSSPRESDKRNRLETRKVTRGKPEVILQSRRRGEKKGKMGGGRTEDGREEGRKGRVGALARGLQQA